MNIHHKSGVKLLKLVIFDLDGTLVNSLADLADAGNYALGKFGFPAHETEEYRYFVGSGVPELIRRALPNELATQENVEKLKPVFNEYYHGHYADKTKPYDGIKELLSALRKKGIKLAVASNKPDEFTKAIVEEFFGDTFDIIQGKTDGVEKKPAPDILNKIITELGADKNDVLMVGDSDIDILTAENAAVRSTGCVWGFRTKAELVSAGAVYIAYKPADIEKFI